MKSGEIIRVIICTIIGLGLAFWVQPLIFQNKIIYLRDVSENLSTWLRSSYTPSAMMVVVGSLLATIIWCFMTAKAQVKGAIDTSGWSLVWWLLGLLPLLSLGLALYNIKSNDALLPLTGLFLLNGLGLLYWLPTALSSPGLFKHIPPGSFLLRRLLGA